MVSALGLLTAASSGAAVLPDGGRTFLASGALEFSYPFSGTPPLGAGLAIGETVILMTPPVYSC